MIEPTLPSVSVVIPLPGPSAHQDQWDFTLSGFAPDRLYVVGSEEDRPQSNVFSAAEFLDPTEPLPPMSVSQRVVLLTPVGGRYVQGEESLASFQHPDEAVYVLGSDRAQIQAGLAARADHLVFIPTDSRHDLYSWVAYAIAMWDRRTKGIG